MSLEFTSKSNLNLDQENDLLASFFEYTPDLLCIATFDGYFLKVNPAVSVVLGYTEQELLNIKIRDLVFEDDQEATQITRNKMLEGNPLLNFENRYVTKSGELVWLSWTSIPVKEKKYIFAIAKNVTERKKLEQEKEILFAEISKINKDLENFARMASHNLRSPVANIMSLFDLLDYSELKNNDNLNIINLIKQSTQKVSSTLEIYINEIINNEVNAQLNLQKININDCVTSVINSISALVNRENAIIEQDFSAFNQIDFNKSYFESILLNLLTNALKYKKPKSVPQITIKTILNGDLKQLIIADKGIGLDLERVKDKIFGLNQTFHGNKDAKGVGLYLVKKHVNDMGGDITIESEKNTGTTFTITFKD